MARIKIDATCRYGHGALQKLPGSFMLEGVTARRVHDGLLALGQLATKPTGATLTINAYWCPECGYTELQEWRSEDE
jgi:hypothetical protein